MVYVVNNNNEPLMPTTRYSHVRQLLRDGHAIVINYNPLTIKLTKPTTEFKQPITLGVDCGSTHVGLSATTEKDELFCAEAKLRTDITNLIAGRRAARRTRRNKLRYRKARFDNRATPKGWVAPSVLHKIDSHIRLIEKVNSILPVTKIVLEIANFDIQLINNPDIKGVEYQEGSQLGFSNVREYVLYRDGHKCQHCSGKSGDKILNVHHIESRKTGGNAPNNLITLCETCHKAYHDGEIKLKVRRGKSLRDAAVMNIMKEMLYKRCCEIYGLNCVNRTYGYITKYNRIKNNISKSHVNDAFTISRNLTANRLRDTYKILIFRRHNRKIHKDKILKGGRLKLNQSPYEVKGFRLFDIVRYNGQECLISGRRSTGYFKIVDVDGGVIHESIKYDKLRLVNKRNGMCLIKISK
jgi:hypothetical protein